MVYFRCVRCDVKWTKLIDDDCPTCDSPCQVVEEIPPMNWIRDGEGAGPFARQFGSDKALMRANKDQTTTASVKPALEELYIGSRSDKGDEEDEDADDNEISEQDVFDFEEHMTLVQRLKRISAPAKAADDTSDDGSVFWQSGRPNLHSQVVCASSVDDSLRQSAKSDTEDRDVDSKQRTNTIHIQDVGAKLSELRFTTNDTPALLPKGQSSINVQTSSKKKKKPRSPRNQKQNKFSSTAIKVMPKLELPDPIPSPGNNDRGSGWNNVVGKGIEKATKKMQNDTMRRVSEREYINASSYLTRDNENEMPIRERAAIDVRFGIGGAKHDVRRVVPRSALE